MIKFTLQQRLRHFLILINWRVWFIPFVFALPYFGSLLWLLVRGQIWIAQVMLAPLFMVSLLAMLTLLLARLEFRR